MEINISGTISEVSEISAAEFNRIQINSIEVKYGHWRQKSKGPTFALT